MLQSAEYVSNDYIRLNSCDVQYLNDHDYHCRRENGRKDYHILYIAKGFCYITLAGETQAIRAGHIILFRPGECQDYAFKKADNSVSCYFHFTGTGCAELLKEISMDKTHLLYVGVSNKIVSVFEKATRELVLKSPEYRSFCNAYLLEFFATVKRLRAYADNAVYIKNNILIDSVCQLMYEQSDQNKPLAYYANFCHLSVSRFAHIFKNATGSSPLEFITRIRLEKASDLLLNTNLTIAEIAEITGFSSQNYFGRIFKKFTGQSPKKYVDANKK